MTFSDDFREEVEEFFGDSSEIFDYRASRTGNWIEFNVRPLVKDYEFASATISVSQLLGLSVILGTGEITATAYDVSFDDDGSDCVLYILASHPAFGPEKEKPAKSLPMNCGHSHNYQGARKPRCSGGKGCQKCWNIYRRAK